MARVLVVSPHPDDETLGCGGVLRQHAEAGDEVRVVFLTSGEHGGHDLPPTEAGPLREKEALRAADILGIGQVEFWRHRDGALKATKGLAERLRGLIRGDGVDFIYAPHAQEMHPDHRAAARITLRAAGAGPEIRFFEVWTPLARMDDVIDITAQIDVKMAAIRAYESQCRVMPFDEAFLGLARYRGEMFSWPDGQYAEVFVQGRGRG
jgi:N-acetylglucosamine malate deacetylase 1